MEKTTTTEETSTETSRNTKDRMTVAENNTNTEVDTDDITDKNINEPATGLVKV